MSSSNASEEQSGQKKITKVIWPIAGSGTRLLPASKSSPKEIFPLVDVPIIEVLVKQASDAGVKSGVMITGRDKRALEDHFDRNHGLEELLRSKGKKKELDLVKDSSELIDLAFTRQSQPLGDGHAILQAAPLIKEEETVFVMFGDTICYNPGGLNSLQQMEVIYQQTGAPVVLLSKINPSDAHKYGIVKTIDTKYGQKIESVVEKPKKDAPSDLAIVGQYIATPYLRSRLRNLVPGADGEIRLSDAIKDYIELGYPVYGCIMEGEWLDTGDKLGYVKAFMRYALDHPDIGEQVKEVINSFLVSANVGKS